MELDSFLKMENLPSIFQTVTVRFVFENGRIVDIPVKPGGELSVSNIPDVPVKDGYAGVWDGFNNADLNNILFDVTFEAVYTAYSATIESELTRENGLPILLVEGSFTDEATVTISESNAVPILAEKETLLESWTIHMSENGNIARLLLPSGADAENLKLLICDADGKWRAVSFNLDGSYLVFTMGAGDEQFALVQESPDNRIWLVTGIGVAVLILFVAIFKIRRKYINKKKVSTEKAES